MFLALHEIRHEPVRFGLITSIIVLVAYLTFFLASLAVGLAHLYRAGIDGWNSASIAITDASNENLSASRLSDEQLSTAKDLAKENGTTASTLMSTAAVAQAQGVKDEDGEALRDDVFAFGIDLDGGLSPAVTSGRAISDSGKEILVDDSLKAKGLESRGTRSDSWDPIMTGRSSASPTTRPSSRPRWSLWTDRP